LSQCCWHKPHSRAGVEGRPDAMVAASADADLNIVVTDVAPIFEARSNMARACCENPGYHTGAP